MENGTPIIYEVEEDSINGYESHIDGDAENGFEVVNRYTGKNPEEDPVNILAVYYTHLDVYKRQVKEPGRIGS